MQVRTHKKQMERKRKRSKDNQESLVTSNASLDKLEMVSAKLEDGGWTNVSAQPFQLILNHHTGI